VTSRVSSVCSVYRVIQDRVIQNTGSCWIEQEN